MRLIFAALTVFALFAAAPLSARAEEGIAAVVNQDAISISDVNARMRLIMASSGIADSADMRTRMTPQIITMLVEERIKLQEATAQEITVAPEEVEKGFNSIAEQNKIPVEQFRGMLKHKNIPTSTLESQIRSQIAWGYVVQKKIRPTIDVTDKEIDAMLARLGGSVGKAEYLVAEIFLAVDTPKDDSNVRQLAGKIANQLAGGKVPFSKVAGQFSQAAGAQRGGDIGWVQQGQLPTELDQALATMKEGEFSQPVRSLAGYHILLMRKKRTIASDNMPSRDDVYERLGMERLDRAQRRYLLDLKAAAFIEQRV